MTARDALLGLAEWAEGKADFWRGEMHRQQALVGGTLHRIKHRGASRMAAYAMNKMALYEECAAEARRRAEEVE